MIFVSRFSRSSFLQTRQVRFFLCDRFEHAAREIRGGRRGASRDLVQLWLTKTLLPSQIDSRAKMSYSIALPRVSSILTHM